MKKQQGFSLIEILVGMTILLLLIILSLPIFTMVRKAANSSRCSSNLKAIGMGLFQYISDHDGEYPPSRLRDIPDPKSDGRKPAPDLFTQLENYVTRPTFPVESYEGAGVWWCPADYKIRQPAQAADSYGVVMAYGSNKGAPQTYDGKENPDYDPAYRYLHLIENPSQKIYLIEFIKMSSASRLTGQVNSNAWPMRPGSDYKPKSSDDNRIDFTRHTGYVNAFFLDGSVRRLEVEDLLETGSQFLTPYF